MPEPIVIPVNDTNELRIYRDAEWKGLDLVHVRRFYRDKAGAMSPTSKGVTVPYPRLSELIQALQTLKDQPAAP